MFKTLTNLFGKDELVKVKNKKNFVETRAKYLSKKQKVLNLLSKGDVVGLQSKWI